MSEKIRVRFAPSPTGPLHIGGVRTALYNYLFAKKHQGTFILRIEDTDQTRFVPGAEEYILNSLKWLGIQPDEGVGVGGSFAPYRQSERKEIYQKYTQDLINSGKAYYAFDTAEELDAQRKIYESKGGAFQYNALTRLKMRNSLSLSPAQVKELIESGNPYVIRLNVPAKGEVRFQDLIREWVHVHNSAIDDKVLMKSDGMPTYHLANIVDDHLMGITHVIRGEEWLPSAPLHILLYKAFGWEPPQFAHLPLLLKPEGNGKLSKRDADLGGFPVFPLEWKDPANGSISKGFREEGYLVPATLNFLAFLGWNPGNEQELFSLEELVKSFSIDRVSKAGAKFDVAKANWFNQEYLKKEDPVKLAEENLPNLDSKISVELVKLVLDRITFPSEIKAFADSFFTSPNEYDQSIIDSKWNEDSQKAFTILDQLFEIPFENWNENSIHDNIFHKLDENGIKMGKVMQLLRVALTGTKAGPDLMISMKLWGQPEVSARLKKAIHFFSK